MEIEYTLDQLPQVAKQILTYNPEKIILFNGPMGAGKTTLIKELCKILGVKNATSSPTFSIVNEYVIDNNALIYHFDMYRLKSEEEALDMGIEDYLYSDHWCFIEWAAQIANLIPTAHSTATIFLLNDGRRKLILK